MNTAPHYTKPEVALLVLTMQSARATGGRTREDLIEALRGYITSRTRMIKATRKMLRPSRSTGSAPPPEGSWATTA